MLLPNTLTVDKPVMSPLKNFSPNATKLAGTILVVDDENGPRQALRLLLKEYVSIYTADNAQTAREFITHEGADVVVTDIRMPGESGIELLQWIKDRQPATEVIILTGYGEVESAARAVELGAFAYLEKPFDNDQMVHYVQNALEKHHRELERRQLEKLALEANRFETVGRFISGMLHDLGTPLSVIATNIDLILLKPELPGMDKRLSVVRNQASYCNDLVRSAMNILRNPSQESELLDVNEIIENCLDVGGPVMSRQGVVIQRDFAPAVPLVKGEFGLIRQALLNLITNACQAMQKQLIPREITVRTWADAEAVYISVADTGPGISPEMRDRIFQPFFSTKGNSGTGIGLAAVCNIMHRHKGEVFLGAGHGRGAEFVLSFPRNETNELPTVEE